MNTNIVATMRKHKPYLVRQIRGGGQALFRFANGYGASIVRHSGSYGNEEGLFELAVIKFTGPEGMDWKLDYDTPITDDVLGNLDMGDLTRLLDKIEALPEATS